MYHILQGFEDELTVDQVKLYAKPEYNCSDMVFVRHCLRDGLTKQQIEFCMDPKFNDGLQQYAIEYGFRDGLTSEQIKFYADPKFDGNQMRMIEHGFKKGLTMEQVELYAKPEYNWILMSKIEDALLDNKSMEEINKLIQDNSKLINNI